MPASILFSSAGPPNKSISIRSHLRKFPWPLLLIVAAGWYLRARNPHYSSPYMDESIYILYGRMFLTRHFQAPIDHPLNYSFGWYLWPIFAAWTDRLGGIVGVRELAAAMGAAIIWAVYGFANRIFGRAVGLASALIFAFLGPAVFASRIATRDIGSLFFFAGGLWLFVRAWEKNTWAAWIFAALSMFAAFLCKYLIAIYFPFLVILALRNSRRAILGFFMPLGILCAFYAGYYWRSLVALWRYGRAYGSLKAPATQAWQIYFSHRLDFWILVALSALAIFSVKQAGASKIALLWCGAAIMPLFQIVSRADYDYWKHVNYSLLFLAPLGTQGLLSVLRRPGSKFYKFSAPVAVTGLAVAFGWMGNAWHIDRFVFWPNTEPITAYFQGRLVNSDRVLVDDTVLRYSFSPPLPQWQITDPFYFRYDAQTGAPAYSAAVENGLFDYIVLDGGIGKEAESMAAAIQPALASRYTLKLQMPEPNLGQEIRIYERGKPPAARAAAQSGPQIQIIAPASNAIVQTNRTATTFEARVRNISAGDYVVADVFTNRWYQQTERIRPGAPGGDLSATIYLAGEGREQCHHIVRAQLFDPGGHLLDSALSFNVARANANRSAPACH